MDVLAMDVGVLWGRWVWPLLQLVIGLGLVIFVHEFGHFIVAKLVGIKVERFALGFGPRLFGIVRGETDYCVNVLPLGGYVKMLGQEDFKPLEPGQQGDPRAFNSKSIGARFAVVAAGVIMNLISAAILFVIVGMVGIPLVAPIVGGMSPGYPAKSAIVTWDLPAGVTLPAAQSDVDNEDDEEAAATQPASAPADLKANQTEGLRPGDKILRIDGDYFFMKLMNKDVTRFSKIQLVPVLAGKNDVFTMTIEREIDGRPVIGKATLGVKSVDDAEIGGHFIFGVERPLDVVFDTHEDFLFADQFHPEDKLLAIDGKPIRHAWDIAPIQKAVEGKPVVVTVERDGKKTDVNVLPTIYGGNLMDYVLADHVRYYGKILVDENDKPITLRLEDGQERTFDRKKARGAKRGDELLDIVGMAPRLSIRSVEEGSPADRAGLKPGDIIVSYADRGAPTLRALWDINEQYADKATHIVVLRDGKTLDAMEITPKRHKEQVAVGIGPVIDLTHLDVAGVRAGSPAAKAEVKPGDVIEKVNDKEVHNWDEVYAALKGLAGQDVTLTYRRGAESLTADVGKLTPEEFDPAKYRFSILYNSAGLRDLRHEAKNSNPLKAMAWGMDQTWDFIVTTYATLRSLISGDVSPKSLSGPVGIGSIAVKVGRKSPIEMVYFMAMISVSIAVMNFLPIPVLDGGLALFLLIEKIRRKPLSLKVMNFIQMAGLVLILALFVAITWQDIARGLRGLW